MDLGRATHNRIYAEEVLPESGLLTSTRQEHPRAVLLAGQPGAGKGGLVALAEKEFAGHSVTLDLDEKRRFHPRVDELREAHPYTWASHTHQDARGWTDKLTHDFVEGRRNIVFDTTLGGADHWIGEIKKMQGLSAQPYQVEVRVLATHRLESELGVHERFARDLDGKGYGRYVPEEVRKSVYDNLPANLDKVHEQTGARIRIYNREGHELYDSRTSALKPSVALEQAREARLTAPQRTHDMRDKWRTQDHWEQKLPESLKQNAKVEPPTAQNVLRENSELQIKPGVARGVADITSVDRTVRVEPAARAAKAGLKVAGDAALAYDAISTGRDTARLLDQDNLTGAQSQILHFGGRNTGMVAGAVTGARVGAALGVESGPGLFATGALGGVVGAVAGDKLMDAADRARIYNQQASDGHTWQADPQHPERGWSRHAPAYGTDAQGRATYEMQTLHAGPRLAGELNYKASSTAVELALAHAPDPKNPFSQPAQVTGEPVRPGIGANAPWTREPQSHAWTRQVMEPATALSHGMPVQRTVTASPEQSRQLEAAAQATIAHNISHGRPGIAQQYQNAYDRNGWKQYGPVPAAVLNAQSTPPTQQRASDGHDYTQGKNGEWTTPGTGYGTRTAQGSVRDELNATKQQVQAKASHATAPAPIYDRHDARMASGTSASASSSAAPSTSSAPAPAQQSHLADAKARHAPATYDKRLAEPRPIAASTAIPATNAPERDDRRDEREAQSLDASRAAQRLALDKEHELNRSAQADLEHARQGHAALEKNVAEDRERVQEPLRIQEQERAREQEHTQHGAPVQERRQAQEHAHGQHRQHELSRDPDEQDVGLRPSQPWQPLASPSAQREMNSAASASSITDKEHPGNALYEQALAGLQRYNAERDIAIPVQSASNMAAALAVEAASNQFKCIDLVQPENGGERLYAVQGKARPCFQQSGLSAHPSGHGNPAGAKLGSV